MASSAAAAEAGAVVPTAPAALKGADGGHVTGRIASEEDMVALGGLKLSEEGAADAAGAAVAGAGPAAAVAAPAQQPAAEPAAAVELTPEQEAAAAECASQFVELYEHAFLSRAVAQLAEACAKHSIPEAAMAQRLRGRGIDLAQLQARAAEVQRGMAECSSDEGWKLIQDGALRLLYRHSPGSTVHCFKATCVLPAPVVQPLSMAREFDLVKTWNSYITHSPILKTFCDIDCLVYASVWMPWPFAERDVLISAVADDHLKDKGVIAVSFASPPDTPSDVDLPEGADQRVHIYFTQGSCMTLTPLAAPEAVSVAGGAARQSSSGGGQHTKVCIVSNIDSRIHNVPEAIISFVLRVFAPFMHRVVLGVLHKSFDDPREPLPQRMAAHHELYDQIRQRCQDFLDGHPQ